jgi:hypothetical protein
LEERDQNSCISGATAFSKATRSRTVSRFIYFIPKQHCFNTLLPSANRLNVSALAVFDYLNGRLGLDDQSQTMSDSIPANAFM